MRLAYMLVGLWPYSCSETSNNLILPPNSSWLAFYLSTIDAECRASGPTT
jgi:hypothetical protein